MASDSEACCESDPNFAVICGFLEKFGVTCGLANIDFLDLQDMLENSQEVPQELVNLHVKLLRKARKSVSSERWERAIIKLCHGFCIQDAWEIERFGYKKARLSSKLRILKELLEMQFDFNAKFKNEINKLSAEELRTQPLGKDRIGHVYWFQSDNSCQIRVYKEDPDEETWSLVAKDREGLVNLITQLNDGQVTVLNEDSSSLESEKPVVDTGQTDSNSNSNSSKQDQTSTDTNAEEIQVDSTKKEESDCEKPQFGEEDETQNNIELAKLSKMRLKNNKAPLSDDTSKPLGNGNGESMAEQELKNEANPEKDERDKCVSTALSPPKTGISIRIKPISELISTALDVNKKPEITGVKEKYIRSDSSSSSSIHHRKAVDSAGFDVHTNYLKRPIEEEEDVQEPSYIKRPRLDRPTLLGNKKKKPYSDEEDEEEEVSDEVEEPLMLVTGEGSGQDNECGNSKFAETGSPIPEEDSPIVGEEIVESVVYFYGEGNGHACETGNDSSPDKQDVATRQQNTMQNTTPNAGSTSDPNLQHTSHESNKADTVDSIKDSEPSSSNDEADCLVKTPTKSEFKLGTIIDVRTNKSALSARDPAKKSRWDIGKPEGDESQSNTNPVAEETSKNSTLQCNSISDTNLELKKDTCKEDEIESQPSDELKSTTGKVQELVNQWENYSNPSCKPEKPEAATTADETSDSSVPGTPKKSMFFFGPGCLQVRPSISPIKSGTSPESLEKNNEQMPVEDHGTIQELPNLYFDETHDKLSISSNLELKTDSYEVTGKTETLLESGVSKKQTEQLKNNDLEDTFKKPQVQKSFRNADFQRKVDLKSDVQKSTVGSPAQKIFKNTEKPKSIPKALEKGETKIGTLQEGESISDNNLVFVKENSKNNQQESNTSKINFKPEITEVKEMPVSKVTEVGKTARHNEEEVGGDSKVCDNLKLCGVQEQFLIKQSEKSTSTIGNTKAEDKICNLPNNSTVTGNQHVPKNSVNKKEPEKIDSCSGSVGDDQKDNKLSDLPVPEKSHISTVSGSGESETSISMSLKVAGLPVAEEQVENSNTSVLDNKPKSKLEDVQENIKKVNIQKTDSIDLSIKNKDPSSKLKSNIMTSEQPCSIEMQMAMIMGENLSDTLDIPEQTAHISISSKSLSTSSNEEKHPSEAKIAVQNPISSIKQIISNTTDNVSVSSVSKPPSNIKTPIASEVRKLESSPVTDSKTQTISKDGGAGKKIVLKRTVDTNVTSTNLPSSSAATSTLISKPVVGLPATDKTAAISLTSKAEIIVAEPIMKILNEKQTTDLVEVPSSTTKTVLDSTSTFLPGKPSTIRANLLPTAKLTKGEDAPSVLHSATHKLDEKQLSDKGKDVSAITETGVLKGQQSDIDKKRPDVAVVKKLDDKQASLISKPITVTKSAETFSSASKPVALTKSSDPVSSVNKSVTVLKSSEPIFSVNKPVTVSESSDTVNKPVTVAKPSNVAINLTGAGGDASPVGKNVNTTKEISIIKPVVQKSTEKQSSVNAEVATSSKTPVVDAKPSATKSTIENISVVSSTAKVSEIQPVRKAPDVVERTDKVGAVDSKAARVPVTSKPSNENFRIPAEYQSKKSSSAGVSSLSEKPVLDIDEVIVNATSGIPSNVNKSRVISLTEILSTSEKVPLSATKGGISKPSTHKLPVAFKEAPVALDVNKQSATKSKTTPDAVVNKLLTETNIQNADKTDSGKVNKSSNKDTIVEDKIVTNKKVLKAEATRDSTPKPAILSRDSSVKTPAPPMTPIKSSESSTAKPVVDKNAAIAPVSSKDKPITETKQPVKVVSSDDKPTTATKQPLKVVPSKDNKQSIEMKTVESSLKAKSSGVVEPVSSKSTPPVEAKDFAAVPTPAVATETVKKSESFKDKSLVDIRDPSGPILSKDKPLVDTKLTVEPVLLKEKPTMEAKKSVEAVIPKDKPTPETKKAVEPVLPKDKPTLEAKKLVEPVLPKEKPTMEAKKSVEPVISKDKPAPEAKKLVEPVLPKDKPTAETNKPVEPVLLKDKPIAEVKKLVEPVLPKDKPTAEAKKSVEPVLPKNKPTAETKKSVEPVVLKNMPIVEVKKSVEPVLPKEKPTVEAKKSVELAIPKDKPTPEAKKSVEPVLPKEKPTAETKKSVEPVVLKDKPIVEVKKSVEPVLPKDKPTAEAKKSVEPVVLKDKRIVEVKKSVEPVLLKDKPIAETKKSVEPVLLKDKPITEVKKSLEPVLPKDKQTAEAKKSVEPVLPKDNPISETKKSVEPVLLKDKPITEVKKSVEPVLPKDKPISETKKSVEPVLLKDKPITEVKKSVEPVLPKDKQTAEAKKSVEPILPKDKLTAETKKSVEPVLLKDKPITEVKKSVEPVLPKDKQPAEAKKSVEPVLPKDKPISETKKSVEPVLLKDKPIAEVKKSVEPVLPKDKPTAEAKKSVEPVLPKDKPTAETKKSVEPVLLKDKPIAEVKKSVQPVLAKKMLVLEAKKSVEPLLQKDKPTAEAKKSVEPVVLKDTPTPKGKKSVEPVFPKGKAALEAKKSVEPIIPKNTSLTETKGSSAEVSISTAAVKVDGKPDTSKDKVEVKIKDSHESNICKDKPSAELAVIKDASKDSAESIVSKNETAPKNKPEVKLAVEPLLSKNKPTMETKDSVKADVLHSKEVEGSDKSVSCDNKVSVKLKSLVIQLDSSDALLKNKSVSKELIKSSPASPTEDIATNRRVTRRTRSNTIEKAESSIDNKNKKSVNNKVSTVTKKIVSSAKKSKKSTNEKSEDESEATKELVDKKPEFSTVTRKTALSARKGKKTTNEKSEDESEATKEVVDEKAKASTVTRKTVLSAKKGRKAANEKSEDEKEVVDEKTEESAVTKRTTATRKSKRTTNEKSEDESATTKEAVDEKPEVSAVTKKTPLSTRKGKKATHEKSEDEKEAPEESAVTTRTSSTRKSKRVTNEKSEDESETTTEAVDEKPEVSAVTKKTPLSTRKGKKATHEKSEDEKEAPEEFAVTTRTSSTRKSKRVTNEKSEDESETTTEAVDEKPEVSAVTKKITVSTRKGKKATNEKGEDDEITKVKDEKSEENEKPKKSEDADVEPPRGKGKQQKKALKENENEEKPLESKKVDEAQVVGDTNRELRHRKVAETVNKTKGLNESEEKKPRGRGRPKGKASTVTPSKEETKTVPSFTRSQAQSVKDKEGTSKADSSFENVKKIEPVNELEDFEEQIVKTEIRPSKKLRLSDSSVEITVIDKGRKTVTIPTSEKDKELEKVEPGNEKSEPTKTRRSLRSSQPANADKGVKKDQAKISSEPKPQLDTDTKEEAPENQELKPVDEPLCVQKKVPLLTCIDISKLKAQPDATSDAITSDEKKPIDSPDSDGSFDFGGDVGIDADADGDSSDDAVVIVPDNDPLACSDEDAPEPAVPPMTMTTFKLDTDDASPTLPVTRVTRKRAAQQSVDALRATRVQKKKTQLEKKEEDDSKKPKLKKRSVDSNLRRSIEEQKLKAVSSSEEEEGDKIKSEPKDDSGKKSKGIAKRRISTRSTRATESPVPSSDALSEETSRTDASNTPPVVKEKKPRKTKKTLLGLEISEAAESLLKGDASVRQSRRIAQLKIKEEAERRKLEEVTLQELKDEQRKRKGKKSEDKDYKIEKRKRNKNLPTEDETTCDAESDEKKKRKRKRKHWDPTKKFDLFKAWKSSSGSSSSEVEDEEEEIEEDEDHQLVVKSDHEFSPESDLEEGAEVQPLKRARTARKESDAEEEVDDCACQKCGQKDHPEWILLCDSCDCGWHCSCLRPALLVIPEGDWFCPPCQHITLVKNLEERLHEYDRKINKRDMETRRKERLAYVGISLDNVLPSKEPDEHRQKHRQQLDKERRDSGESGSDESDSDSESGSSSGSDSDEPVYQLRERRQAHSYRFNDYDELINSAIQDELEAVKGAGNQGRGKDIATIVNAEKEEAEAQRLQSENVAGADAPPSDAAVATVSTDSVAPALAAEDALVAPETATLEQLPPVVPPNYDAKTADDSEGEIIRPVKKIIGKKKHRKLNSLDVSSDDDAESDEDFKGSSSSESEEDFDEDEYTGSESSDADTRRGKRRKDVGPVRRSTRARISRYDRDFVNDSDSEEEEAPRRKKTRSLWDESESEESDRSWGRRKRKAANRSGRRKSSGKVKKSKKKKKKRRTGDDSDPEVYRKRPNIKFGGLNDDEEVGRRTRGKKINYLEALGTDSEEEIRRKPPRIEESEEEYNLHEDEDFQQQLANDNKDSDESGVDTVLQDIAKNTQPPKARGRGKSGLKIPRKPKDAPPPEFPSLMPDLSQSTMEPSPSIMDPTGLQPLQPIMQPLMTQPPMLGPPMVQESDLQDPEDEPNPIELINKNVEQMNEQEMEKMMEEEDYANKQLQLVALQIEKEKKRKEREAKRLEKLMEKEQKIPKKRGRKPKNQLLNADLGPPYSESASMLMNSVMANNAELSEPPGVSLPMFSEIAPVLNADGTPKKRRGRGKDSPMHGTKLGIAAPPQPFSQSQPTPSVITRMLQSQPGQGGFPGGGSKYFSGLSGDPQLGPPPGSGSYHPGGSGPRGPIPGPYQQPPPGMPQHYPVVRSGPAPPHRLHSPGPPGLPPMYHTHRSMDPSPSGGGPINVSTPNRDRHSPAIVPPSSSSPLGKGDPTPPPPPYTRPQVGHFAPGVVGSAAAGPRHVSLVPSHLQQHRGSNMSPYHPGVPPNYHYGSYPPPPPLNADEGQSPPVYPSPAYSEAYSGEGGAPVPPSEGSGNKPFDEDTGGEFVGLVSYFSSQREDDLDT